MLIDGLKLIGTGDIVNAHIEQVSAFPTTDVGAGRVVYLTAAVGAAKPGLYIATAALEWVSVGKSADVLAGNGIVLSTSGGQTTIAIDPTVALTTDKVGAANGLATLDSNGKLPLSQLTTSVLGALVFVSTWNAATNTPALTSGVGTKGHYYTVAVAGTLTLDGVTSFQVGDMVVFNGTAWDKIDGAANEVRSVAGRTGNITLTAADVSGVLVPNTAITPGTGTKVTFDSNGFVTGSTTLTVSDIPSLDWSKITTGKPTTLSGYGITDAFSGNTAITPGTGTKITYDAKGLVTSVTTLVAADIPALDYSKITTGKPTTIAGYGITDVLAKNTAIAPGTATKLTYDASGLVTSGTTLTTSDIPALDYSKITTGKPTTIAGYGITDAFAGNAVITPGIGTKVSYDAKGLVTSATTLAPGDIPSLDFSKITSGKPTTVAGYGITDVYTKTEVNSAITASSGGKQTTRCTTVGALTVSTGTVRLYPAATMTLDSVFAAVNTTSTGADIKVDIKKNGVSILGGNLLTIVAGSNKSTTLTNSTQVTTNDYLTVDITQIGTTVTGSDLVVTIYYA